MTALRILLHGTLVYDLADVLRRKLAIPAEIGRLREDAAPAVLARAVAEADVIIAIRWRAMPPAPRLRLLQVPGAGTDDIDLAAVPPSASVCNVYGHDVAAAEYALLGMLACCHDFIEAHESFRAGSWRMSGRTGAPLHEELHGKTVGVLGLGPIGLKTAALAKAFGTRVLGCNRTARPLATVDAFYPLDQMHAFLGECDFVVVSIALASETRGLIDAAALDAMKSHAVLVNVARGPVVEERSLFEALRDRRIAGAVIDAWYRYPSPDDPDAAPSAYPFATLPNVLMTPHSSIWTRGMIDRRWTDIAANVTALAEERPLQYLVRPASAAV